MASRSARQTREQVIEQFRVAHGDKYDYSKFVWVKNSVEGIMICPIHDEFKLTPKVHKRGVGCKPCGVNSRAEKQTKDLTNQRFGKLKVIRKISLEEKKELGIKNVSVYWLVQCACGRDPFPISGGDLRRKKTKGRNNPPTRRWACKVCTDRATALRVQKESFDKIQFQKNNLLTVLRFWGSTKRNQMKVLCQCECVKTPVTQADHFLTGHAKSCGCTPKGEDSLTYFKANREWADSIAYFYIAELDDDYLKVGITYDLKDRKRKSSGNYQKYLFRKKLNRSEVWAIEQTILHKTIDALPKVNQRNLRK